MELRLWDTAGQEDYASLRPIAYKAPDLNIDCHVKLKPIQSDSDFQCYPMFPKDTHVVLIAFSVVNRDTFENVETMWMPEYNKHLKNAKVLKEYTNTLMIKIAPDNSDWDEGRSEG